MIFLKSNQIQNKHITDKHIFINNILLLVVYLKKYDKIFYINFNNISYKKQCIFVNCIKPKLNYTKLRYILLHLKDSKLDIYKQFINDINRNIIAYTECGGSSDISSSSKRRRINIIQNEFYNVE